MKSPAKRGPILVALGGLIVVAGSFMTWGVCTKEPCEGDGGLFHLFIRSGIDFGPGIVTGALGIVLVVVGLVSARSEPRLFSPAIPIGLSCGVILVVAAYVVRVHLFPEYTVRGPGPGVFVELFGAVLTGTGGYPGRRTESPTPTAKG